MTEESASAYNSSSAPASSSAARTRSMMKRLERSALPFFCDAYGAVFSDVMPLLSYHALRSWLTYSIAPSWRTRFTLSPVRVSSVFIHILQMSCTIALVLMGVAVMKPVESTISVMEYTEPPNDFVKGPATSV